MSSDKDKRTHQYAVVIVAVALVLIGAGVDMAWLTISGPHPAPPSDGIHRISGVIHSRWPGRMYEGSSGIVEITLVSSGTRYDPAPPSGTKSRTAPYDQQTRVREPRIRITLASDSTLDIVEPKTQERIYDATVPVDFSWSIYARETGDHITEARLYIEEEADHFSEMTVSPLRMKIAVMKLDHVGRTGTTLGLLAVGILGAALTVRQLFSRPQKDGHGA